MKDTTAPFCPTTPNDIGDVRCCVNGINENEITVNAPEANGENLHFNEQ